MNKTFNWLSFVNLADRLIDDNTEEAYRTAVSRAYYGVFCHLRWELENRGTHFTHERIHFQVIQWFKNQKEESLQEIGSYLNRLREARVSADYKNLTIDRIYAENNIIAAHDLIKNARAAKLIHD